MSVVIYIRGDELICTVCIYTPEKMVRVIFVNRYIKNTKSMENFHLDDRVNMV